LKIWQGYGKRDCIYQVKKNISASKEIKISQAQED
jgi:hypothetical protein